ncbi:hypothetical protein HCN44_003031 [Aphidius gifuensis]|uniref:Tyrosine--tRNA ligase n=1 Tax=Aphidius gifuensis TaxID=684658 RepID=A0A835CJV6_APHGI|nr:tyrosine--tRNA ligase, mitochondrial [Aphidius gifuensis]KAF7987269.1 hypothetical protein HCN44_003031 [Aphidius gifuensis]
MITNRILRLFTVNKLNLKNAERFYSQKNILHLHDRGMFQDIFPASHEHEIKKLLNNSPQCVYAGFDPTADSLHVGNLLVLMNLLHWQRSGHQVIVLLGGATGQIGDPSDRTTERTEINNMIINDNINSIRNNIENIFNNHKLNFWQNNNNNQKLKQPIVVNNIDWYKNINIIDFIRNVGKKFRLGTMIGRSSVQTRLNSDNGMSFTEFSYQIFQAYDWLHLYNKYNCRFQIGGGDQMGNIVSGHDLISKTTGNNVYGLTLPLITSEGGKKFGKSLGNAIWLSSNKSSSFSLYQFFMRTKDSDVDNYLKLFTFLKLDEIKSIINKQNLEPEKRYAQRKLAEQVTLLVHGEEGLAAAEKATAILYDNSLESLSKISADELVTVFEGASIYDLPIEPGMTAYDLAMRIKCFKNDKEAQRILAAGGYYINHSKIINPSEVLTPGIHILKNNTTLVRVGKKNYHVIRWLV